MSNPPKPRSAGAVDLHALCNRLASLAQSRPSEAARQELLEGLGSKWDGVQVVAARSLATWADPASLEAVRATLLDLAVKPNRWAAVSAIADAMSPHVGGPDVEWIVHLVVRQAKRRNRSALFGLLVALPRPLALAALHEQLNSPGADKPEIRSAIDYVVAAHFGCGR